MKKQIVVFFLFSLFSLFCVVPTNAKSIRKPPPLISVIMPVTNNDDFVFQTIDSVLKQSEKQFEFIIVGDGLSAEKIRNLFMQTVKDKRIRFFQNDKLLGKTLSKQKGLDEAKGDYITIISPNSLLFPDRFEKSLNFMKDYPWIDMLISSVDYYKDTNGIQMLKKHVFDNQYKIDNVLGDAVVDLFFDNPFSMDSVFIKRDIIKKNGVKFTQELLNVDDYDFFVQLVMAGVKIAKIKDKVSCIQASLVHSNYQKLKKEYEMKIRKKLFSLYFKPKDAEIKSRYNRKDRCLILKKIILSGRNYNNFIKNFKNRYKQNCPENLDVAVYLIHRGWTDFLIPLSGGKWTRKSVPEKARLFFKGKKLIVKWDRWPQETYQMMSDGNYYYEPFGELMHFKHKDWERTYEVNFQKKKACPTNDKKNCVNIIIVSDDVLRIDWKNRRWGVEEFKKISWNTYEYVRTVKR